MELEATIVGKYSAVAPVLDERSRRLWAASEAAAIGYGGDALVSSATGLARETIRKGRREIARGEPPTGRIRAPGAGRPGIEQDQPGVLAALEALVDPLTRGDPTSPLRWTCKSRAKLAAALSEQGWRVSSTTVGRLLHRLGYRLQSVRKRQEGTVHPDRNEQFEHINATADRFLNTGQPVISVDTKGRRKNRFPFLLNGFDGVVPFRHDAVRSDSQLSHLGVGDLDAGLVGLPHEVGAHTQSGGGACGAQIFQDGLVAVEGAARPVLADFAEQAVFDGVPLRRGGRVMGHGDAQAVPVAEAMLQVELPGARRGTVAAAAVGEDLQGLGLRIVLAALGAPPLLDAVDGERRGVGGSADVFG